MTRKYLVFLYSPNRQNGKSTTAQFIKEAVEDQGRTCKIMKLADPIKRMVQPIIDIYQPETRMGIEELKEFQLPINYDKSPTYRDVMVDIGALLRSYDIDVFCKGLDRRANTDTSDVVVCDDLRAVNEWRYFQDPFGHKPRQYVFVKVRRPGRDVPGPGDRFEGMLEPCHFPVEIVNDGSQEDLRAKVHTLLMPELG